MKKYKLYHNYALKSTTKIIKRNSQNIEKKLICVIQKHWISIKSKFHVKQILLIVLHNANIKFNNKKIII